MRRISDLTSRPLGEEGFFRGVIDMKLSRHVHLLYGDAGLMLGGNWAETNTRMGE